MRQGHTWSRQELFAMWLQYWTAKLDSMWPRGWNAAWPGQPAPKHAKRTPRWELQDEPAIAERLYEELLQKITSDADGALRQVREIAIPTARRMVQWISRQRSRVAGAIRRGEAEVEAALRQRVREKVKERDRQYIKFLYGSKDAFHLHLRDVLRNCSINSLHPKVLPR